MEFNGTIKKNEEGKVILTIHRRKEMDHFLSSLFSDPETRVVISIEKLKKSRSNAQNRYYWGQVVPIIQRGLIDLGHDLNRDEVHEFLKMNFNYTELVNEDTGELLKVPSSTSKLSTKEFMEYIERISRFAAEMLHEVIPMPGEQAEIFKDNG